VFEQTFCHRGFKFFVVSFNFLLQDLQHVPAQSCRPVVTSSAAVIFFSAPCQQTRVAQVGVTSFTACNGKNTKTCRSPSTLHLTLKSKTTKECDDPRQSPSHLCCQLQVFHPPSSLLPPTSQLFIFLASLSLTRTATSVELSKIQNPKTTKERNDPRQPPSRLRC
jgi:hypothetical protein